MADAMAEARRDLGLKRASSKRLQCARGVPNVRRIIRPCRILFRVVHARCEIAVSDREPPARAIVEFCRDRLGCLFDPVKSAFATDAGDCWLVRRWLHDREPHEAAEADLVRGDSP